MGKATRGVCPIMSAVRSINQEASMVNTVVEQYPEEAREFLLMCLGPRCQFWETMYTSEGGGYSVDNCAFVLGAMKNSEGKYPV